MMRLLVTLPLFCLITIACYGQSSDSPVDTIWLEPTRPTKNQSDWFPEAITKQSGEILGLDQKSLRFRAKGDEAESIIAANRLIWVERRNLSDTESKAIELFQSKQYGDAIKPLIDAVTQRPPVWRQQWLSMSAAFASWRSGRGEIALELVSQLDQRPIPYLSLAWLPIQWNRSQHVAAVANTAKQHLVNESPLVRLVAASWLTTGSQRTAAVETLRKLSLDRNRPIVARLADAVLWQSAAPPEVIESRTQWEQRLNEFPLVLQIGPSLSLAQALRNAGEVESAKKLEWSVTLTPPFPYPQFDQAIDLR